VHFVFVCSTLLLHFYLCCNLSYYNRKLSEHDAIPESYIPTVLDVLRRKVNDEHDDSRNYALYTLSNLVEHRMIPSSRLEETLEILLSRVHDAYPVAGHNALWGISVMAERGNLMSNNTVSTVVQNMLSICHDGTESTQYNYAIFILYNLAKGEMTFPVPDF